jgi:hypothetical protein
VLARVLTGIFAEATLHVLRTGAREQAEAVVHHLLESLRATKAPAVGRRPAVDATRRTAAAPAARGGRRR